jgi:uncharacterized protein YjbI with pentapeptide repeats
MAVLSFPLWDQELKNAKQSKQSKQPNNEFNLRIILPKKKGTTELTRLDQTNALKILSSYGGLRSVNCTGITFTNNRKMKMCIDGTDARPRRRGSRRAARIKNSVFTNCKFDCHIINFVKLKKTKTPGGVIENCNFTRAIFTGRIYKVMFRDCDFRSADLSKAELKSVQFVNCNFRGTKLPNKEDGTKTIDYRNTLGNHNRNPFNWERRNLDRIKYDKNAKGMNPDKVARKHINSGKRIRKTR